MSIWMLTTFAGNILDAVITAVNVLSGAAFFMFFAVLMFCVAAVFVYSAVHFRPQQVIAGRASSEVQMQEPIASHAKQRQQRGHVKGSDAERGLPGTHTVSSD